MRIVDYLPFSVLASAAVRLGDVEERGHTTKRIVPIYPWPGLGVWTAGHPGELDMEAGVRGGCEVDVDADAEGKQKGDCGKEGHGGLRSSAARCREAERGQKMKHWPRRSDRLATNYFFRVDLLTYEKEPSPSHSAPLPQNG